MTVHLPKGRRIYRYKFFVRKRKYQGSTGATTREAALTAERAIRDIAERNRVIPERIRRRPAVLVDRASKAESTPDALEYAALVYEQLRVESKRDEIDGVVYFIGPSIAGPVKIGFTRDLDKRLGQIQIGSPSRVHVLAVLEGTRRMERYLHWAFERARGNGEWFDVTPELRLLINLVFTSAQRGNDYRPQAQSEPVEWT